jgi:hypothetical protein
MIENPTPVYYEKNIFCTSQWGEKSILLLSNKISSNSSFTTFFKILEWESKIQRLEILKLLTKN